MAISSLVIDGLKSFRDRTEVKLDDLTILSGANSSGKSTIMHAILLLKQTLESSYDPGPLLISGPNVVFSNSDQMFWNAPGDKKEQICIGLSVEGKNKFGYEINLRQQKDELPPLQIVKRTWVSGSTRIEKPASLTDEQHKNYEAKIRAEKFPEDYWNQHENIDVDSHIQRDRFFSLSKLYCTIEITTMLLNLTVGFLMIFEMKA